jgi:uncharacterized damage-inducible protein DinB
MKKPILFLSIFFVSTINAQYTDSLKVQLLKDWTRAKAYSNEYLQTMPTEKYLYAPTDSTRNFAQQVIHFAQANISLVNAATGATIPAIINRQNLETTKSAHSKDSVTYFMNLSYDYAIAAITTFNFNTSFESVSRGKLNETKLAWLFKAYEHQAHHRGQLAVYLRLVGVKPPFEKLFN